jgi:hypothetical protein
MFAYDQSTAPYLDWLAAERKKFFSPIMQRITRARATLDKCAFIDFSKFYFCKLWTE